MATVIVVDEFHVTISAPRTLPETEFVAIYQTLNSKRFQADLRRAVRTVCRQYPDLANVRVTLSR